MTVDPVTPHSTSLSAGVREFVSYCSSWAFSSWVSCVAESLGAEGLLGFLDSLLFEEVFDRYSEREEQGDEDEGGCRNPEGGHDPPPGPVDLSAEFEDDEGK